MGYRGDKLAKLGDPGPTRRAAVRIAEAAGDALKREVEERTPIAEEPPVYAMEGVDWVRSRGGRTPGTLKRSWKVGTLRDVEGKLSIEVFTNDPIAVFVEYPTRPHRIRARNVDNLRFPDSAGTAFVFTPEVMHPGTQGSYMMRDALAFLRVHWQEIARRELRDFGREQMAAAKVAG